MLTVACGEEDPAVKDDAIRVRARTEREIEVPVH